MSSRSVLIAGLAPALLLAFAAPSARAAESYDNCVGFITSLPVTLNAQGVWCMNADRSASLATGTAVTVGVNNVTIDCNGFKLGNLGAGPTNTASGIWANGKNNVTLRNCNIRGYYVGALLNGSGHVIEDTRFEASGTMAIDIYGDGSSIRRNFVFDTGTGTHLPYAAIHSSGTSDILDNTINGVVAPVGSNAGAIGIFVDGNYGGRIEGNGVRGILADGTGTPYGIFVNNTSGTTSLSRNRVKNDGAVSGNGFQCAGAEPSVLVDNQSIGFDGLTGGCTDLALNLGL
jgi:hypothetical protein